MIRTYWTLRAFNAYSHIFQNFGKVVIMWDIPNQKLYVVRNVVTLIPYITQLFVIFGFSIFLAFYVGIQTIAHQAELDVDPLSPQAGLSPRTYPPKALAVLFIVLGCIYPLLHIMFFIFYFYAEGLTETVNALVCEVKKETKHSKTDQRKNTMNLMLEDVVGFGIFCSVYFLYFLVVSISLAFFAKLDPLYYSINWTLHSTELTTETIKLIETLCIPIRMVCLFVISREAARLFPMTLAVMHLLLQFLRETLNILNRSENLVNIPRRINYSHILLKPSMPLFDIGVALLLAAGLQILVITSYVTLRMYNVLPLLVYLAGPVVGIFVMFFIQVVLPSAVVINESSVQGLTKAYQLRCMNMYTSKYARATRPISFRAGSGSYVFFHVGKEFMRAYYQTIVTFITDALMAFS